MVDRVKMTRRGSVTVQERSQRIWNMISKRRMRMKKVAFVLNLKYDHVRQIKHRIRSERELHLG